MFADAEVALSLKTRGETDQDETSLPRRRAEPVVRMEASFTFMVIIYRSSDVSPAAVYITH
jgi:hypothetical protein